MLDVRRQGPQRCEYLPVFGIVGTQLEAVTFGDRQREFERIDRIQTQAFAEQRRVRIDGGRILTFQI